MTDIARKTPDAMNAAEAVQVGERIEKGVEEINCIL